MDKRALIFCGYVLPSTPIITVVVVIDMGYLLVSNFTSVTSRKSLGQLVLCSRSNGCLRSIEVFGVVAKK